MKMFVACYDLNETNKPHGDFLAAAIASGWSQWIKTKSQKWRKLPNTTIVGSFTDHDAALASFKSIKGSAEVLLGNDITIEKYFITEYSSATIISDEEKVKKP